MLPSSEFLSHQVGAGRHGCLLHTCAFQGAEPLVVRGSRARAAPVLCLASGRGRGEVTTQLCTLCVPRGSPRGLWAGSCMREWRAAWTQQEPGLFSCWTYSLGYGSLAWTSVYPEGMAQTQKPTRSKIAMMWDPRSEKKGYAFPDAVFPQPLWPM